MKLHQLILICLSIWVNGLVGRSHDDSDSHRRELQIQQANLLERKDLVAKLNGTTDAAVLATMLGKEPKSSFFDDFECKYLFIIASYFYLVFVFGFLFHLYFLFLLCCVS